MGVSHEADNVEDIEQVVEDRVARPQPQLEGQCLPGRAPDLWGQPGELGRRLR